MKFISKHIRIAGLQDAAAILSIYAPYIEHTSFTFENVVPPVDDFKKRMIANLKNFPWLVCEVDGKLAGYAYASRYRERVCYQWSVECSVYIHDDYQHAGIGADLYNGLMSILKRQGFMNVYAVINLPNPKSVRFHERFGFTYFATYENVGFKLGEWKNVGWWQLKLNEYITDPPPPISFELLDKKFIPELFESIVHKQNEKN